MRFSISHSTANNLNAVVLTDELTKTEASVLPQYGALLHSFSVVTEGKLTNTIDNYESREHLQNEMAVSFKGSKLSPFACRIPNGKYHFNGQDFEFQQKFVDGSAIHGLLYDKPFVTTDEYADNEKATITLHHEYRNEDPGYPFHYRCEVQYTLNSNNLLSVTTMLVNLSYMDIPVADGWHPYFKLGGKIDEWLLSFQADGMLEFGAGLIPTGRLLPFQEFREPRRLGSRELDNCFLLKKDAAGPVCRVTNPNSRLELSFFPDAAYPYLQIYTAPHRLSMAIENLSGAPDCFNNKMGLLLLSSGDSQTFTAIYQITVL